MSIFNTTCSDVAFPPTAVSGRSLVAAWDDYYTDGLITSTFTNFFGVNPETKTPAWYKVGGAEGYITSIQSGNNVTKLLIPPGTGTTNENPGTRTLPKPDEQQENDKAFMTRVQGEYCFYKTRYNALLTEFLADIRGKMINEAFSGNAQVYLDKLIEINTRMNALVQLIKYIGDTRIANVNNLITTLNEQNTSLQNSINNLSNTGDVLNQNNTILHTRKEMVRYTKEKNNAIMNQVSLWASLNVVAIAIIFHLYRTL